LREDFVKNHALSARGIRGTLAGMIVPAFSRRRFLSGTGAWLGAAALGLGAAGRRSRTISIIHTTDLHGHILPTQTYEGITGVGGFARCASCIRQWQRESPHSLLVDAGDVYQGTAASLGSGGKLMMELFNRLGYDAWTLGNHDFDWGPETLEANLLHSKPAVLTGNLQRGGKPTGELDGAWSKVRPWQMKEAGGFRIALIGLVTPGLPFWLTPDTLGGIEATDPAASLKRSVAEATAAKADAIVVIGHMGWRFQDDFANQVREVLRQVKGVDVYLGGHSHQDQASWMTYGVLCSQSGYHGIHCGRVDLTFDVESRKLIDRRAFTLLMDDRYELDPVVMELAGEDLARADEQLARRVGTVTGLIPGSGRDSRLVRLFCEFFAEALEKNQTPVDGVFHGTFGSGDLQPGDLTVADCWKILPYENLLVIAEVSAEELVEIVSEDAEDSRSDRTLWPFELVLDPQGRPARFLHKGRRVQPGTRFKIAFNSYDSQSGGRRLPRLRDIVTHPDAKRVTTPVDTRSALIDGILKRGEIP